MLDSIPLKRLLGTVVCMAAMHPAQATENGGLAAYPDGLENYMVGAMPPPGVHLLWYAGTMRYDRLRGNDGKSLVPDFKVTANVLAPRVVWVTQQKVFGGDLALHAIAPLLDIEFRAGGARFKRSGLGDMTFGVGLGYHVSPALHYAVGLDVIAPVGRYDRRNPASPGKNYATFQPLLAITYTQPDGINADLKLMYDFNLRNRDTDTRSGQAIHADYSLGWGFGNGWAAGVGGHFFRQVTDDRGPNRAQGKARALGFGPSVRYANQQGWLFTLKWQQEYDVRNRPEGRQLHMKLAIPF